MLIIDAQFVASKAFIANNSFEQPVLSVSPGFVTVAANNNSATNSNWTFTSTGGSLGFLNPVVNQAAFLNNEVFGPSPNIPDGAQTVFNSGGTISQTLSATLQANTRYILSAFVGRRFDRDFPGFNIELLAGSTVLAQSGSSVTPNPGTFQQVIVSYSSGSSVTPGQALQIRLTSLGPQTNFDFITLDILTS